MENSKILRRRLSLTRKLQIVCAALVFFLTSALAVFQVMQVSLANNGLGQAVFELGYLVITPANLFVHVIGISEKIGVGAFLIIAILLNTILAFCFVGLLGRLIAMVRHKLQRPKA